MKRIILFSFLLLPVLGFAQDGYEIKVSFKPFKNQYVYLGHYFGKSYPIIDSAMLNDKSEAVLKGNKKLNGGIYLIGYPNKAGFFEILVDKEQKFSIKADTLTIAQGATYEHSSDNVLFSSYQQHMSAKGKQIQSLQHQLKTASNKPDSTRLIAELTKTDREVKNYREDLIKKNPGTLLATLLIAMREPELTGKLKDPKTKEDSLASYNFYKDQFWEGVNFWDGRLAYTTFFEDKLDKYFNQLVIPHPDSVIREIDNMLGYASVNEEMTRFLLIKFVNRYINQKYMWEDAVFVHLFEKYFSNKDYTWLAEKGKKTITDRAYSLMANIMGTPASDIELPDSSGKMTTLYNLSADYTVVVFWDPSCGHCKEVLPRLDSFYRAKWKGAGLKMFAVSKETDGSKKDWTDFIHLKKLEDWTHVYYSKADDKARISSGIPGYSQLYDVQSFPTLYLLDKDKRIVAKKLAVEQINDVLELKRKGQ
ncbi:MAG TPA: thioredoxin-like domain-containing protein [Chitinophagaceae bacterium]|nr:thioredoxin-like domain-containing protein [Chitinophagaceae bacterium]